MCKSTLIYTLLIFHYCAEAVQELPGPDAEPNNMSPACDLWGKSSFVNGHNCWRYERYEKKYILLSLAQQNYEKWSPFTETDSFKHLVIG